MQARQPEEASARPIVDGRVLPGRCPVCSGRVYVEYDESRCLWCARLLEPERDGLGRITGWVLPEAKAKLSNAGRLEDRRIRRQMGATESRNGVTSRVLLAVPAEGQPLGISRIAKKLALPNQTVREAILSLESLGYVARTEYRVRRGHRYEGYLRAAAQPCVL